MMHEHFRERCYERGITTTCIKTLYAGIRWAIKNGRDDLVELAYREKGNFFWRFRCPDGIFYAVTHSRDSSPVTVYTQEMLSWHRKRFKNIRR